jgi:fibronectin type 3 domain-containing protein
MRYLATFLLLNSLAWTQQGFQKKVQLTGRTTVKATNHTVALAWTACPGAGSYNLYRATIHAGPYKKIISGISAPAAIDQNAQHGATYYYVVTSVSSQGESGYSNETIATIP